MGIWSDISLYMLVALTSGILSIFGQGGRACPEQFDKSHYRGSILSRKAGQKQDKFLFSLIR
jgi:hypothetical protein